MFIVCAFFVLAVCNHLVIIVDTQSAFSFIKSSFDLLQFGYLVHCRLIMKTFKGLEMCELTFAVVQHL